jgi:hypothetical protein
VADDLVSRYGEPEAVYRPSRGQTFAGVLVCSGAAVVCFAAAAFGCGFDVTNRVCGALLGAGCAGLGYWLHRQRKWRLVIFTGGLVQVRAGGVDELAWADVTEVIRTRLKQYGEPTVRVTVVGPGTRMVVSPVNLRSRKQMFETLLAAAERRGMPVRVEWEEVS